MSKISYLSAKHRSISCKALLVLALSLNLKQIRNFLLRNQLTQLDLSLVYLIESIVPDPSNIVTER